MSTLLQAKKPYWLVLQIFPDDQDHSGLISSHSSSLHFFQHLLVGQCPRKPGWGREFKMGTNILDKQSIENVPVPYNGTHESADQLSEKVQENVS